MHGQFEIYLKLCKYEKKFPIIRIGDVANFWAECSDTSPINTDD